MKKVLAAIFLFFGMCSWANASVVISPDTAYFNTAGEWTSDFSIDKTIDQSGLSSPFISGVTDFDLYFSGSPTHLSDNFYGEWFASENTSTGDVAYDLGDVYTIDRVALWNEDLWGIASFKLYTDTTPFFTSYVYHGEFTPADNAESSDYLADIFSITTVEARYVYLDMTGAGPTLSLGEIAFSANNPVPDPATIWLFGLGLMGITGIYRKKSVMSG